MYKFSVGKFNVLCRVQGENLPVCLKKFVSGCLDLVTPAVLSIYRTRVSDRF